MKEPPAAAVRPVQRLAARVVPWQATLEHCHSGQSHCVSKRCSSARQVNAYASAPGHDRSDGGDAQEIELRGSLGSRGRRVGDDAQAGAADAEHVAIELDVTDDIVPHDLPLRLVLAHGAALPQLPEPVARRQQFLDQGPHPAIAGVSAVNPAEVGHERRLEGAGIARPADDPSLAVAQGRPGEV